MKNAEQNAEIIRQYLGGMPKSEIADTYNLNKETVNAILKDVKREGKVTKAQKVEQKLPALYLERDQYMLHMKEFYAKARNFQVIQRNDMKQFPTRGTR